MKDREWGYHWLWILPLWWLLDVGEQITDRITRAGHRRRIRRILRDTPQARRMCELAGIRQK